MARSKNNNYDKDQKNNHRMKGNSTDKSQHAWLVTGAAGFLGSHVIEQLLAQEKKVVAVDNLSWGPIKHLCQFNGYGNFTAEIADIRDLKTITNLIRKHRVSYVIHLAALHYIPAAIANPVDTVSINVLGTQNVLSATSSADLKCFWYASTGDVYQPCPKAHKEEDPLAPFNIYGLTKLQGEQLVKLAARTTNDTRYIIGRLFNLYGTRETNPHILPEILQQLKDNPEKPLRLGNLWPARDLVPVRDAARAVIESIEKCSENFTILNVGSGMAQSMQSVLDIIGKIRGTTLSVETDPSRVRPVEREHMQADVSLLNHYLGWVPSTDLEVNLRELLLSVQNPYAGEMTNTIT